MAKKYVKMWTTYPVEEYVNHTPKAYVIHKEYSKSKPHFLPKSIVKLSEPNPVNNVVIAVPMWWLIKEGFWYDARDVYEFVHLNEIIELEDNEYPTW